MKKGIELVDFLRDLPRVNVQPGVAKIFLQEKFTEQPIRTLVSDAMQSFEGENTAILYTYVLRAKKKAEWGDNLADIYHFFLNSDGHYRHLIIFVPKEKTVIPRTFNIKFDVSDFTSFLKDDVENISVKDIELQICLNLLEQYSMERVSKPPRI